MTTITITQHQTIQNKPNPSHCLAHIQKAEVKAVEVNQNLVQFLANLKQTLPTAQIIPLTMKQMQTQTMATMATMTTTRRTIIIIITMIQTIHVQTLVHSLVRVQIHIILTLLVLEVGLVRVQSVLFHAVAVTAVEVVLVAEVEVVAEVVAEVEAVEVAVKAEGGEDDIVAEVAREVAVVAEEDHIIAGEKVEAVVAAVALVLVVVVAELEEEVDPQDIVILPHQRHVVIMGVDEVGEEVEVEVEEVDQVLQNLKSYL